MKTKHFRPFRIGHLTKDLVVKAKEELNETDQTRKECLLTLRELVLGDTKLKCWINEEFLVKFLRAQKYNSSKAFSLLQAFFRFKKSNSDLYSKADIPMLRKVFKAGIVSFLPYRGEDDCPLLIINNNQWDPDLIPFSGISQALMACLIFAVSDPATQVTGIRVLFDSQGCSLKQLKQIMPRYMHLISKALRNCLPVRFKGIHIFNESILFQYFWEMLKIFLSDKIRSRIHFHGDNQKQLQKFIAKEILPEKYGGDNTEHSGSTWYPQEIEKFYDHYSEFLTCGYDS